MAFEFGVFAALALALGLKHAFDADHLVAVSNLLTRKERLGTVTGLAGSWAVGHLVTAALVSAAVFAFADTLLPSITARLELLVPLMLLLIGVIGLAAEYRRFHVHRHAHAPGGPEHAHLHVHIKTARHEHGAMAGIGVVHGLASNDELLVVLVVGLAANSWWQLGMGVALFSAGVLLGMVLYAAGVHAVSGPLARRTGATWLPSALSVFFSVASVAYAVYLLAGGEGLNLVERWLGERLPAAA